MKKLFILFIIGSCFGFAQGIPFTRGAAAIKLGYYNPTSSEGGFIIGYEGSAAIDENVRLGWSLDWFHKNNANAKLTSDPNSPVGGTTNELLSKTNIHQLPLQGNFTVVFPAAPRVNVFGTAGIGGEILFINYRNYANSSEDEFHASLAFNWRIGGGITYNLNPRSEIIGELTYHSSAPSWEYEVEVNGVTRTYEREFDMAGIMLRIGYRFFY